MNYKDTQSMVTKILRNMGLSVSLSRDDVVVAKTYGVFSKSEELNVGTANTDIDVNKTMFLAVTKVTPEVGDYIIYKTDQWYITKVDEYKPAGVPIAFKVEIS
jgi:hypothetical protein